VDVDCLPLLGRIDVISALKPFELMLICSFQTLDHCRCNDSWRNTLPPLAVPSSTFKFAYTETNYL
jgi:hypothetical protein